MTLTVLFQKYILNGEFEGKALKLGVRYKNMVTAKDLITFAYTFWQIMVSNVLPLRGHLNDVCSSTSSDLIVCKPKND